MTEQDAFRLQVRPFQPGDQAAARDLILAGMEERWGWLDETANPDLDDIAAAYCDGCFLVALYERALYERLLWDGALIGTGALLPESPGVVRIVRMSVAARWRRRGVGRRILAALLEEARRRGCHQIVLETTSTWRDAVHFYTRAGFTVVAREDEETHMRLSLAG